MTKWQLPKMEDLSRYKTIVLDTETSGLNHWDGARTVGTALGLVRDDGSIDCRYYAYGHDGGDQYTRGEVMRFLNAELVDKDIIMHHANFDTLMALQDDLDLRKNTLHCTMMGSILLNPNDYYTLDHQYAVHVDPNVQKLKLPFEKDAMQEASSDEVGEYAEQDVRLTWGLHQAIQPKLVKKQLESIYRLECDCVSPTVEMQNNGLHLNVPKLELWIEQVGARVKTMEQNFGKINPNSGIDLKKKFDALGLEHPWNFKCEKCSERQKRVVAWQGFNPQVCPYCKNEQVPTSPHFGKDMLARIDHPFVKDLRQLKVFKGLLSGYLVPWSKQLVGNFLPYQLNQLRDKKFDGGGTTGTVTGRYSASMWEGGKHPQQIFSVDRQTEVTDGDFILRELCIPEDPDDVILSVDASQIEYRLFGHFAYSFQRGSDGSTNPWIKSDRFVDEYTKDPFTDYHDFVGQHILGGKFDRKKVKAINFGILYGMKGATLSRHLRVPLEEAYEVLDLYGRELPETRDTAGWFEREARIRHEIRTIRGRLFEFSRTDKTHIALSRLIQGSAADIMKEGLVKVWKAGLYTKMRLTIHDEIMGDGRAANAQAIVELLDDTFGIRLPLRWSMEYSRNWAMTSPDTVRYYQNKFTYPKRKAA
jgi:DNA polymerase I-like protein with 3'-5' exonuclease and polymerase domains